MPTNVSTPAVDGGCAVRVVLAGGLGNQLFQLAAGLVLAAGAGVFLVDGIAPVRRHNGVQPDIAGIPLPNGIRFLEVNKPSLAMRKSVNAILRSEFSTAPRFAMDLSVLAASQVLRWSSTPRSRRVITHQSMTVDGQILPGEGTIAVGYFQSHRLAQHPSSSVTIRNALDGVTSSWVEEMRALSLEENPLIVHVRLSDYRNHRRFGNLDQSYYARAIEQVRERKCFGRVWLASDEPNVAMQLLPGAAGKARIIASPADQAHPALTLAVLRLGAGFVLANSSFAWWAAAFSVKPSVPVVAPVPWFVGAPEFGDLMGPTWIAGPR